MRDIAEYTESEIRDGKSIPSKKEETDSLTGETLPIHRGRVDSVKIYEVLDTEIDVLENGPIASIWLNFAIGSISIFASFLVSLLTSDYSNKQTTLIVFICVTIIFGIFGLLSFIMWLRNRKDYSRIIQRIKSRIRS